MKTQIQPLPFEGYETLSEPEKTVFDLLHECEHDSLWNLAITNVLKSPDVVRFRKLICELKGQNDDNPEVMKVILGSAYEAVVSL